MARLPFTGPVAFRTQRLVMVTGAGSGIGRATALRQAQAGDTVIAADIDLESACETAALAGDRVHARHLDITKAAEWESLLASVVDEFGVPDILVNNAGMMITGAFFDQSEQDWERIMSVNLLGAVHGSRIVGAAMAEKGTGGHIVILSSGAAFAPFRMIPSYSVSKAAVLMFAEVLRIDLASKKIGVSAICPGPIRTNLGANSYHASADATKSATFTAQFANAQTRFSYAGPDKVARAIQRAIRYNLAIVPVNPEAFFGMYAHRFAPGLTRQVLRLASNGMAEFAASLTKFVPRFVSLERFTQGSPNDVASPVHSEAPALKV